MSLLAMVTRAVEFARGSAYIQQDVFFRVDGTVQGATFTAGFNLTEGEIFLQLQYLFFSFSFSSRGKD